MLRVTTTKEKRSIIWIPVVIVTCTMHIGFFYAGTNWAESKPRTVYEPSRVEFRTVAPAPEPLPETEPEAEKIELPEPEKKPEIKVAKKTAPRTPKPNTSKPEPKPAQAPSEPAKAVFGVTADSVSNSGSGVAIRVGNTLAKEMEKKFTKPKEVTALPPAPKGPVAAPAPKPEKKKIKPVPVYELSKAPTFKKKIEPKYPDKARRDGIEGTVQLEILIDENGRVRKVKVLKSPGHGLERAAIAAVSKSKFHPGVINGKAVPVKIKIPYRFVLDA
ncbi:MAG: energy transducer TonB [Deltaproteobacteria bacterium]|nr:energy transducer TonB [Deltaproteobacteria bacterium]